ncbi:MAG TPA: hypothetical protein VFL57_22530, partial [Bryobacteraceae bacterium]|nr:hypothetical protein [Bryobacteraceae bacterium]
MRTLALVLALTAPVRAETLVRIWKRDITSEEVRRGHSAPLKYLSMTIEEIFAERYLRENQLEPTADQLNALRRKFGAGGSGQTMEWFVQRIARSFALHRSLWQKHGGRVVTSAFGPCMANDAFITELHALEKAGALRFSGGANLRHDLFRYLA